MTPRCEVSHLRWSSRPPRHAAALDDISFDIAPGEILGVVGESGAGKSLTGAAIIGLLEPPGASPAARSAGGRRIDNLPTSRCAIRGREIGAIFQDPLTSLNPLYTVGRQLVETIRRTCLSAPRRASAPSSCWRHRHPGARGAHRPVPAPVLRRHAPARGDRAGAGGRAEADRRRRADHRAGRVDPGADHCAAQAVCRERAPPSCWSRTTWA
jgi:ABC-type dipeptide/oligopeptide/nickel transport system ATPase component